MDLNRLKMFLQIVDTGSMSAAARAVHLTQPALSRNLKLLEGDVGVPLFERRGRGLVQTAAGRALVPRARALIHEAERASFEVSRCARRAYFDLRLGTVDSVATFLVPQLVAPLTAAFPELAIKFSTARTAMLLKRVRAGELDVAVVAHSGPPPDVRHRRVSAYRLQFFGRKDRFARLAAARSQAEVQRFPIVEIEPPPGDEGMVPDEAMSYAVASNVASVKALVLAGFGVGDMPDFMLTRDERRQLVAVQVPHDPDCGIFVVGAPQWNGSVERKIEMAIANTLERLL
ncbi:MAG TPA: LysR family transcriptional regulator, partial [Polyangia bacterium]|nr:LysR family transcriptional regulator [Polyangia bacterium]